MNFLLDGEVRSILKLRVVFASDPKQLFEDPGFECFKTARTNDTRG